MRAIEQKRPQERSMVEAARPFACGRFDYIEVMNMKYSLLTAAMLATLALSACNQPPAPAATVVTEPAPAAAPSTTVVEVQRHDVVRDREHVVVEPEHRDERPQVEVDHSKDRTRVEITK
jgi:Flp pilus assembly protein TadG